MPGNPQGFGIVVFRSLVVHCSSIPEVAFGSLAPLRLNLETYSFSLPARRPVRQLANPIRHHAGHAQPVPWGASSDGRRQSEDWTKASVRDPAVRVATGHPGEWAPA